MDQTIDKDYIDYMNVISSSHNEFINKTDVFPKDDDDFEFLKRVALSRDVDQEVGSRIIFSTLPSTSVGLCFYLPQQPGRLNYRCSIIIITIVPESCLTDSPFPCSLYPLFSSISTFKPDVCASTNMKAFLDRNPPSSGATWQLLMSTTRRLILAVTSVSLSYMVGVFSHSYPI